MIIWLQYLIHIFVVHLVHMRTDQCDLLSPSNFLFCSAQVICESVIKRDRVVAFVHFFVHVTEYTKVLQGAYFPPYLDIYTKRQRARIEAVHRKLLEIYVG